jgi:N-acetylglucosamine repressor
MRRINPSAFKVAKRGTSREINRQITLNLIRVKQPISRAELARMMGMRRGAVTLLINELIEGGLVREGAKGQSRRGRRPQHLYIDSRKRCVVAVDIRASRTFVMVADLLGHPQLNVTSVPSERDPRRLVDELVGRVGQMLREHPEVGECQGWGIAVPGILERDGGRVLNAPTLGWRDVDLGGLLAKATTQPIFMENSCKACALGQVWAVREDVPVDGTLVFVSVSDGVGVGIVIDGRLVRGAHNIAGEFGHVSLNAEGPRCSCGANGCWEAYISNLATLTRYLGRERAGPIYTEALTVEDIIGCARAGDARALDALETTWAGGWL